MTFRVSVTRFLMFALCLSLIIPWSSVAPSALAEDAGPGATPASVELDDTPAPEPDEAGESGDVTPEPVATEELPGSDTDEGETPDDLTPETNDEVGTPGVDPPSAPLSRPDAANQPAVGTLALDESTVSVTVSMADGGSLPGSMNIGVYGMSGPAPITTTVLPGGFTSADVTFSIPIPYGSYRIIVTGAGYAHQLPITVEAATESYAIQLDRLPVSVSIALSTADEGVIPVGTKITIVNQANDLPVHSMVLPFPGSNGMGIGLRLGVGEYSVIVEPGAAGNGRQIVPTTIPFTVATSELNLLDVPVTLDIQFLSSLTITVTMSDGGLIPHGLIMFPDWDQDDAGIPVPGGSTSAEIPIADLVPYGQYLITFTNDSVSMERPAIVNAPEANVNVPLARYEAPARVTLNTSDGGVVPAGSQWTVTVGEITVASGVLAEPMASGSSLDLEPLLVGNYQFSVSTPPDSGDRQFIPLSEPMMIYWLSPNQFSFTLERIAPTSTVSVSVAMADAGTIPGGLQWTLFPSGSWDPVATGPVTDGGTLFQHDIPEQVPYGQYQLWITGNGYSTGRSITVESATTGHGFQLTRLLGTAQVTLNTSDGGEIPAGTTLDLMQGSTVVASVTYASPLPASGTVQPFGPFDFGVYELRVTPPTAATGRQVVPQTIPVNMTNSWVTEYAIEANLEIFIPTSTVSVAVEMIDASPIPMGLQWALFPPGSWDPIATGPVTAGGLHFEHEIPEQVPYGVYQLWITGNGYSSGQVINVQSDEFRHGFALERLYGNITVTVTTNDGSDIPAGTTWEIRDASDTVLQSGTLAEALPNGSVLQITNPFEFGVYTLSFQPGLDMLVTMSLADLPRDLLPFSTTINVTNPWFTEYPVAAELQWAQSDVTFSVSMSDTSPLPNGLSWMLVASGSWDPLASGTVTAGEITFGGQVPEPVPYGTYQLWITGNGYSSGQVMNIQALTTHHDFVLDRLSADVTVTLDTSDDAVIPAGTTWSIVDSADNPVENGVLSEPLADGGILPLTNLLQFDVYTLVIDADGYHLVTLELAITNPWLTEMSFTANLVSDRLPEPTVDPATPDPATPAPATPAPATPAPATPTPAAPVTGLPQTGFATTTGSMAAALVLLTGTLLIAGAGFLLRSRSGSTR